MKMITNGAACAVVGIPVIGRDDVRIVLPEPPKTLGATVALQTDDGMLLREWTCGDFLRAFIDGAAVVLTQTPEPVPVTPDIEAVRTDKLAEVKAACNASIVAGCDVTLADGTTGHIGMTDEDQINLLSALAAVKGGEAGYPYHLDGTLCKIYAAADILLMGKSATAHKLYHTTYCNHLNVWINRCTAAADIQAITYGAALPDDLKANMEAIINAASAT